MDVFRLSSSGLVTKKKKIIIIIMTFKAACINWNKKVRVKDPS